MREFDDCRWKGEGHGVGSKAHREKCTLGRRSSESLTLSNSEGNLVVVTSCRWPRCTRSERCVMVSPVKSR